MNKIIKKNIIKIKKKIKRINFLLEKKNFYKNKRYLIIVKIYKKLIKINKYFDNWIKYIKELNDTKLLISDPEFSFLAKNEINKLNLLVNYYYNKLKKIFLINKKKKKKILSIYLEIHAGTGGNEATLFVYDLFKMYVKFSELMKWKVKLINFNSTSLNGYKDILCQIKGFNVYKYLRFESGGHRVQRIPFTESKGRVHTSTCLVAVTPDIDNKDLPVINNEDIKIDTFRSSGAGGQHVNTTDSAVRLTHLPTGIVVECQQERSQHKNKSKALKILKSRIYDMEISKRNLEKNINKKKLLGTGFRSDRNRTYNFTQNRVTDHRINLTIYSLNNIMNGKLNLLINPLLNYFKKK